MLAQFFNDTIEQSFLKALLSAVQLPKYKIVKSGDLIFQDYFYILNNKVIKCTKTGVVDGVKEIRNNTHKFYPTPAPIENKAEFEELEHYYFSNMSQNIEFKEFIRASYYSTELHKRFGEYLRCLRDLYGVDLMGMYNCFDYEVFSDFHLQWDDVSKRNILLKSPDPTKKLLAIPVKFNTEYSIYLTSNKPFFISPVLKLANKKELLGDSFKVETYENAQFNVPIKVSVDLSEDQGSLYKYEKYLYLVIQIDSINQSSLVVLEGNYTNSNNLQIFGAEQVNSEIHTSMIYKPALIQINDGVSYAYSNTIIQYLLHNVITNIDTIEGNISYAKELLNFKDNVNYWSDNIKYSAFVKYLLQLKSYDNLTDEQMQERLLKNCEDVTGFIDKQIERWLNANLC